MAAISLTSLSDKINALRDPGAYPHVCASVEVVETHFACVFLTEHFAYKLKKPVVIERMDFTDLAARERNCREELRLNHRLAALVYLDVTPLVVMPNGSLRVGGEGQVVDWLVKMRSLPQARMLDRALLTGTVTPTDIKPAAELLARFFREQVPALLSGVDYLARMHAKVDDVRAQLLAEDLRLDPAPIEDACAQQREFLVRHADTMRARGQAGKVIEGHGDLRPEHVFLGDAELPAAVIDSLEFDRDLRIFDPVEELAFLQLECERIGAAWAGDEFMRVYCRVSGDEFPASLFNFYRAQRALTRAKIAAWHVRDPDVCAQRDWRALAQEYIDGALSDCRRSN